jgi:hypothetical protein
MERNCVPLGEGEGDRPKSLLWTKEPDPPWRGSVPGRIPWGPTIGHPGAEKCIKGNEKCKRKHSWLNQSNNTKNQ